MARDFIKINTADTEAVHAQTLKNAIGVMRQAYMQLNTVKGIMTHLNDGTVFTDIETRFGLPAGKGQTVFNLVNGATGSFEAVFQVADAKTITEQVG